MSTWRISEAKAQFSAVLREAAVEPQIICRRGRPEAAVVDISTYRDLAKRSCEGDKPTVAQLLTGLREIQKEEPAVLEIPDRVDRANPFVESS